LNTSAVEAELVDYKFNEDDWLVETPALDMGQPQQMKFDACEAGGADEHRDARDIVLAAGVLARSQGLEHTPHEHLYPGNGSKGEHD